MFVVLEDHNKDKDDRIYEHTVIGEPAQDFGQKVKERGGNDRAEHIAESAENDEYKNEYGCVEIELCSGYAGIVKSVKGTRSTRNCGGSSCTS